MADSVNRIVPPSVSQDRSPALGREREKKDRDDSKKRGNEEKNEPIPSAATEMTEDPQDDLREPEKDKTKGKNLDISA